MKTFSQLDNKKNNLKEFKSELENAIEYEFNSIEPFEPGRMISMLNAKQFDSMIDREIKDLCEKHNVFIANVDRDDAKQGFVRVMFESTYGEKVTKKFHICFHLTDELNDSNKVDSILKNGLKPMKATRKFKMKNYHPERIYMLTEEASQSNFKKYSSQLLSDGVIIIDLDKLKNEYGETVDLFKDPQSAESVSVYTDMSIRKEALTYMKNKDFFKSEFFSKLSKY